MLKHTNASQELMPECRVCSQSMYPDQAVSLFSSMTTKDDSVVKTIVDVMKEFANVLVHLNDDRSKHICTTCLFALESGFHLQQQIRANELAAAPVNVEQSNESKFELSEYEFEYLDEFKDAIVGSTNLIIELPDHETGHDSINEDEIQDQDDDETQGKQITIQLTEEELEYLHDGLPEQGKFIFQMPPANLIAQQLSFDKFEYLEISGERCCGCAHIAPSSDALMVHAKEMHSHNYYADSSYTCPTCYQKFPTDDSLAKHTQYYSYSDIFLCNVCQEAFNFRSHIMLHLKQEHDHQEEEDGYESESAKKKSLRKCTPHPLTLPDKKIIKEIQEYPKYRQYLIDGECCCACGLQLESIQSHIEEEHKLDGEVVKPLQCAVCLRVFSSERLLILHEQDRRKPRHLYECRLCCTLFSKKYHLLKHFQTKLRSRNNKNNVQCADIKMVSSDSNQAALLSTAKDIECFCCCFRRCKEEFTTEAELLQHAGELHAGRRKENELKLVDAGEIASELVCSICLLIFESVEKLQHHRSYKMHAEKQRCHICGRTFMRKSGLREHQEREHLNLPPRFSCNLCGKNYITLTTFKQHMRTHGPFEGYPCDAKDCDQIFRDRPLMRRHFRNVHAENKPYACRFCQKGFRTKESLDIHVRSHTGERPFACRHEGCNKRYSHGTDRLRHERSVHTGERPHKCMECSVSFFRKRELRKHIEKLHI